LTHSLPAYWRGLLTLFDTVLAAMSDWLEAPVWTFDHHFDVMQANVWR
jgi:hypothetical protein